MDGSTSDIDTVRSDATAWAMPWPQLILLAGLALVIGALVWGRRRSQKRLESMLETAREEGRRSATSVEDAS